MPLLQNIEPIKPRGANASGLLAKPADRKLRQQQKAMAVLRFLRTSIYSTADILGQVMAIKSRSAIALTLSTLEKKQLLRSQTFNEMGGRITLWGITAAGQEIALQHGEDPIKVFFNVSKVGLAGLQHYLSLQEIRVRGEQAGWTDFLYCDRRAVNRNRQTETINDPVRPDLLALDPVGRRIAIESERIQKSAVRYKMHVIPGHVRRINAEEYQAVVWVCRTVDEEKSLRGALTTSIQQLTRDNEFHLERTTPGLKPFNVTSIDAWPKF